MAGEHRAARAGEGAKAPRAGAARSPKPSTGIGWPGAAKLGGLGLNLSQNFIRRPIATSLLMLAIAMFGVIAYRALPVSDLPQVDYPTIQVEANLPGANPETMASSVATVLERQFTTIAGLDSMISQSGM